MNSMDPRFLYAETAILKKALYDRFIRYLPKNLEYAIMNDCSEDAQDICHHLDKVDFFYRQYVAGTSKTLHRVLYEARLLKKCKLYKDTSLLEIIANIENDILTNELYEIMPRHLYAKNKVLTLKK